MTFEITEELQRYLEKKSMHTIVVEVCSAPNSEFECVELHVYGANNKRADFLLKQGGYGEVKTSFGRVLLPAYKLEYADTIHFFLKKIGPFKSVGYDGITM